MCDNIKKKNGWKRHCKKRRKGNTYEYSQRGKIHYFQNARLINTAYKTEHVRHNAERRRHSGVVYYEKRDDYGLYGFFIHINEDIVNGLEDTDEIPKDILDCIMYAAGKGCDWINLDADGTVESGVLRYDGDEVVNDVSANE